MSLKSVSVGLRAFWRGSVAVLRALPTAPRYAAANDFSIRTYLRIVYRFRRSEVLQKHAVPLPCGCSQVGGKLQFILFDCSEHFPYFDEEEG